MYTYVHISYRWISNYFPLRPYYLTKQTILFHQCFVGVSAQHYVSSRFLGSCVAGLVQLPTCHRRWQREPVIALVAPLQTVQSLDIVGYFVYWIWLIWLNSTWYYWTLSDIIDWFLWILLDIYIYILILLLDTCCQFKFRLSWASPSKLHYTSLPFRIEHPEHPKSWLGKRWPDVYSESQNNLRNRCVVYSGFYVYDAFRGVCLHACGDPQCEAVLHIKWGQWKAVYDMIPLNSRFVLHLTSATSYSNHTVIIQ